MKWWEWWGKVVRLLHWPFSHSILAATRFCLPSTPCLNISRLVVLFVAMTSFSCVYLSPLSSYHCHRDLSSLGCLQSPMDSTEPPKHFTDSKECIDKLAFLESKTMDKSDESFWWWRPISGCWTEHPLHFKLLFVSSMYQVFNNIDLKKAILINCNFL